MNPIKQPTTELPKFLVVNDKIEKTSWNKHLSLPYKAGEIVKVSPEQTSTILTPVEFSKRYVRIIRKDSEGKWSLEFSENWAFFELMNNIKAIKK